MNAVATEEQETGEKTTDLCQRNGTSTVKFCEYKSKFGSREISNTKWLSGLDGENARPEKLLTKYVLANDMPRNGGQDGNLASKV